MYGTIVGHGSYDHKGRSYKIKVMKTGNIITRTETCDGQPISAEDYLWKEISKPTDHKKTRDPMN